MTAYKKQAIKEVHIEYIDIAKGIGILLVLLGHLLDDNNPIKSMIYSFHMPLFFIVSGIVIKESSLKICIWKRLYSILIPYFIWAFMFSGFSYKKAAFILYGSNESLIRASSNGMLWFLAAMFVASVVGSQIVTWCKKLNFGVPLLIFSSIIMLALSYGFYSFHNLVTLKGEPLGLPWALDVSFLATSFVLAGKMLSYLLLPKISRGNMIINLALGCLLVLTSLLGIIQQNDRGYSQMATYDIGNPILYYFVAIAASIGIILLCHAISHIDLYGMVLGEKFKRLLLWLGKNSMLIFIMHRTVVYTLKNFYILHNNAAICIAMWIILAVYSGVTSGVIGFFCPMLAGKYRPELTPKMIINKNENM